MKTLVMTAMFLTAAFASPVAAKQQVPFHGSLEASETDTLSFPFLTVSLSGTGQATHLGRFTTMFQLQVDVRTSTSLGFFTLIAANGDSVFGTISGHATNLGGGIASIVEAATITGGTGRFEDATGSFTITRVVDQATGISSGSFNGAIDFHD
jgi:hypothetical protein